MDLHQLILTHNHAAWNASRERDLSVA